MSAHIRAFCAAIEPAAPRPLQIRSGVRAIVPALALLLAGCTDAPRAPVAGPDPSDPGSRAPGSISETTDGNCQWPLVNSPFQHYKEEFDARPRHRDRE